MEYKKYDTWISFIGRSQDFERAYISFFVSSLHKGDISNAKEYMYMFLDTRKYI